MNTQRFCRKLGSLSLGDCLSRASCGFRSAGSILVLALLSGCASNAQTWTSWGTDLGTWSEYKLEPYLVERFTTHPRFKGEKLMFVAQANEQAQVDDLSRSMRQRLYDQMLSNPGIRVVDGSKTDDQAFVCKASDIAHYRITVQTIRVSSGRYQVTVKAYDLEDQVWVSGFLKQWQGDLDRNQRRAFDRKRSDNSQLGARALPFKQTQTDLLAENLSEKLRCALSDQNELRVNLSDKATHVALETTPQVVANHLSKTRAVRVSGSDAPFLLSSTLHEVDQGLYQYWVGIKPVGAEAESSGAEASAYIRLGRVDHESVEVPSLVVTPPTHTPPPGNTHGNRALVSTLRVITPPKDRYCERADPWSHGRRIASSGKTMGPGDCFALEMNLYRDAYVFFLSHHPVDGLVWLRNQCNSDHPMRTAPRGRYRFPSPHNQLVFEGSKAAGLETFYAIAVADWDTAQEITANLQQLPVRCTRHTVAGLREQQLAGFLPKLDSIVSKTNGALDWQAVRVLHSD